MVLPRLILSRADLDTIRDLVGDARVVAIGEGAHNITEFHEITDQLFRFLVDELGFTAFAMESGFAEGLTVDDWVHGGPGSVADVAREGITYRFGECEPIRRQLSWMRDRNAGGAPRVSYYGIDLPGSSASPGPAVRACLARLPARPGDRQLLELAELGGRATATVRYAAMPPAERERLRAGIAELADRAADDPIAARCALSLRALVEELDDRDAGRDPREEFMADTVRWILDREPRIVISAHNAHVQRSPYFDRPTIGGLLAPSLGDHLVVIGTTYGAGPQVRLTPRSPRPFDCDVTMGQRVLPPRCIEALLDTDERPVQLVDLRRAPQALRAAAGLCANGELLPIDDIAGAYDALIHFRRVTAVPGAFEQLRADLATVPT